MYQRTAGQNIETVQFTPVKSAEQQFAAAIQQQAGVMDISGGKAIAFTPKFTSASVTVSSNAGGGAAATDVYIFNNTGLTALDTDNGSGAASIAYSWGDGRSGKGYERAFSSYNQGNGVGMKGFTLQVTNFTTGATLSTAFNTMSMQILIDNVMGGKMPFSTDLAEAIRNTQFISGTLSLFKPFMFNDLMQINYQQPANTIFAWTFFTEYSSFTG